MSSIALTDNEEWLVRRAFNEHVNKCEVVMLEIFNRSTSEAVEMRSWLYDSASSAAAMADFVHTEPLYLVAEYLGIDTQEASAEAEKKAEDYKRLATDRGWNAVPG